MTAATTPDPRRVRHALAYLAALHGGDPERAAQAARQAAQWRARAPENAAAWQTAQAHWQAVAGVAAQLRTGVALDDGLPAERATRRQLLRRAGGGAGLLGIAAFAGWLGWHHWQAPLYEGQWATRPRQHLPRIDLPDGSVLALAADGALGVSYHRQRREAVLGHGLAHFDIAPDAARPFTVRTRLGRVEVLGTAFSVSDRGGDTIHVSVERGRVRVSTATGPGDGRAVDLVAGQRVSLLASPDGGRAALGDVLALPAGTAPDAAAWREGWWRFTARPLAEVAAEFNAYAPRPLRVAPGAATLRLTGSFPIRQPQLLLDALPRVLPVRVRPEADGGWRVEPLG